MADASNFSGFWKVCNVKGVTDVKDDDINIISFFSDTEADFAVFYQQNGRYRFRDTWEGTKVILSNGKLTGLHTNGNGVKQTLVVEMNEATKMIQVTLGDGATEFARRETDDIEPGAEWQGEED